MQFSEDGGCLTGFGLLPEFDADSTPRDRQAPEALRNTDAVGVIQTRSAA